MQFVSVQEDGVHRAPPLNNTSVPHDLSLPLPFGTKLISMFVDEPAAVSVIVPVHPEI